MQSFSSSNNSLCHSPNYYQILGVDQKDSFETIKSAYRSLLLYHHPDKAATTKEQQENSSFLPIQKAWETLRSCESRAKYDSHLQMKSQILIYEVIKLQEMQQISSETFFFPCRCGGCFEVHEREIDLFSICIPCSDCSFYLQVEHDDSIIRDEDPTRLAINRESH